MSIVANLRALAQGEAARCSHETKKATTTTNYAITSDPETKEMLISVTN